MRIFVAELQIQGMKFIPYYIYILLLLCLPINLQAQQTAPKREIRAVWLTTLNGLDWPHTKATSEFTRRQQQRELCEILDQLKAVNINTVLLQTRIRGSVLYPSDFEPWDVALTGKYGADPSYDPLAFAIAEAHRRGMELHAWVVAIPCFKQAVAKQMGRKSVLKTHPELCVAHNDMYYLDPGLPGTADYLVRICHEIVSNYDVDGLHFDYIRYPEGAATFKDAASFKRYGGGKSKAAWRRDNMTHIVRRIYEDTKALKPWVRISSSPVGKYADLSRFSSRGWNARDAVHQDAEGWLREGIHDILFPMLYFDGDNFYPFAADWQEQKAGRQVAAGLGIYFLHAQEKNWPLGTIRRQLHYIRQQGLEGQAYFRSQFLTDNTKGLYNLLRNEFYAFPALTPACTWLDNIAPMKPSGFMVRILDDQTEEIMWTPVADNLGGGIRYNVYASRQWPVDARTENLVATALYDARFSYNRIATLGYYFAVAAMDRCGNESEAVQVTDQLALARTSQKLQLDADGHVIGLIVRPQPTKGVKPLDPEKVKKAKKTAKKEPKKAAKKESKPKPEKAEKPKPEKPAAEKTAAEKPAAEKTTKAKSTSTSKPASTTTTTKKKTSKWIYREPLKKK